MKVIYTYHVIVSIPGSYRDYIISWQTFHDEKKAYDHYTDMLVKYPNYRVQFKAFSNDTTTTQQKPGKKSV